MKTELTDTGFKRVMNKKHSLSEGKEKVFIKCPECGRKYFYDIIPYSLANPVVIVPCVHDVRYMKPF